jgi:hypothetical protein
VVVADQQERGLVLVHVDVVGDLERVDVTPFEGLRGTVGLRDVHAPRQPGVHRLELPHVEDDVAQRCVAGRDRRVAGGHGLRVDLVERAPDSDHLDRVAAELQGLQRLVGDDQLERVRRGSAFDHVEAHLLELEGLGEAVLQVVDADMGRDLGRCGGGQAGDGEGCEEVTHGGSFFDRCGGELERTILGVAGRCGA